ncbi:MAG: hypothetical protein IPM64_17885 [Phycisphaerales bacterium]|nr:hypothetical protein [Phycisphaerales bacterium]
MPSDFRGQQRMDFHQAARDALIDGLRLPRRQAQLLKTLDRLMRDEQGEPNVHTLRDDLGNLTVELVLITLAAAMACSADTARRAYKSAGATPYLSIEEVSGRPHLFTVHWPAIVDDARPAAPQLTWEKGVAADVARGRKMRGVAKCCDPPGGVAALPPCNAVEISRFEKLNCNATAREGSQNAATPPPTESAAPVGRGGWEVAVEQLRDLGIVAAVLVPRAIARWGIPDSEQSRLGILAAACCALTGKNPPALFTDLVKRRAWLASGMRGIAEAHFDTVRAWRRQQENAARAAEVTAARAAVSRSAPESEDAYFRNLSGDAAFERHRAEQIARIRRELGVRR